MVLVRLHHGPERERSRAGPAPSPAPPPNARPRRGRFATPGRPPPPSPPLLGNRRALAPARPFPLGGRPRARGAGTVPGRSDAGRADLLEDGERSARCPGSVPDPAPSRYPVPGQPSFIIRGQQAPERHRDRQTARDPDGQQGRGRAPSHRPSLRFPGVQRKDTVQEACPLPQPESSLGLTSFRLQAGFPVCPGSSPSLKVFRAAGRPGSRGKTLQIVSRVLFPGPQPGPHSLCLSVISRKAQRHLGPGTGRSGGALPLQRGHRSQHTCGCCAAAEAERGSCRPLVGLHRVGAVLTPAASVTPWLGQLPPRWLVPAAGGLQGAAEGWEGILELRGGSPLSGSRQEDRGTDLGVPSGAPGLCPPRQLLPPRSLSRRRRSQMVSAQGGCF
ncbi:uncharacterized protein WM277_003927 [Molossus nigricans]